jgi:hypothetical protein
VPQVFVLGESALANAIWHDGVAASGDAAGQIVLVEQVGDRLRDASTGGGLLLLVPVGCLYSFLGSGASP